MEKKNKITAEEQDTDKHCFERKAGRRKWLTTYCLSSGRHECALRGNPMLLDRKHKLMMDGISMI